MADPGWYADLYRAGAVRYWTGEAWTDHVAWPLRQRPPPMGFGQAVRVCFAKFVTWRGRASMAEYWWFYLFQILCSLPLMIIAWVVILLAIRPDGTISASAWFAVVPYLIGWLVLLLPTLSVSIRRLHDTDRSGAWMWLTFAPGGGLVLLVFYLLSGTPGPNRFGAVPGHETADARDLLR